MKNLIIPATDERVVVDVEHVRSTLKEKYGFKADIDNLPLITPNPAPGRTKYLVLIASKITPQHIVEAEGIRCLLLDLKEVLDFSEYQFMLPPRNALGYFLWMSAGELYRDKAPSRAEEFLGPNERAGAMFEGLHLFSQYGARDGLVNLNRGKPFMDFGGSRSADGRVPSLSRWSGVLRLRAYHPGYAYPRYVSVSAGVFLNP